ncbi:MAG TPA: molybdopterin cofactor-binding domain-containing protein, partial [Acidimicrobiales bacterium]|nr:molybdopterin cofactor-binding domain-containing protein [Acidimicrobiales bacterium]
MSILGHRVLRREDPALLTSGGTYVDDLDLPDAAFVTYVRSTMAHARLTEVDVSEALDMPGVLAVVTIADLGLDDLGPAMPMFNASMTRPLLARDAVRFVGEPIVAIVTERREQGVDAAEAVLVDYEPLDALVDPLEAKSDSTVLFGEAGTNVVWTLDHRGDPVDFSQAEVVVTQEMVNQRLAPSPIEGRSGAAWWEGERLVQYQSCQGAHPVRDAIAEVYGLDQADVRVVCPDVGGSFGAKARPYPEDLLLPWLARRAGRPVRWVPTRSADMVGMGHSRAQRQELTIGGDRDGTIRALHARIVVDAGAYPVVGPMLAGNTGALLPGPYRVREVSW